MKFAIIRMSKLQIILSSFLLFVSHYSNAQIVRANTVVEGAETKNGTVKIYDGYKKELGIDAFVFDGVRIDAKSGLEEKKANYNSTDFIDVEGFERIYYDLPFSANAGIAFYDKSQRIIPSLAKYSTEGGTYDEIVPDNVKYVRFSRRADGDRGRLITLYGTSVVDEEQFFPFQEVSDDRMINPRYQVFSNNEFRYRSKGQDFFYKVSMPNHQVLNDGTIVVVTELFGDGRYLAIKRSVDNGKTWSSDIRFGNESLIDGVVKDNDSGGNPVLLYDRKNDVLFLFYQPCSYRKSKDGGKTWGKKESVAYLFREKYKGYNYYASPCNGIQLTNGVLAIAYRIENIAKDYDRVCVLFSRNGGDTWEITPPTPLRDRDGNIIYADETALVEYKKNCIMLNSRGYSEISYGKRINRRVFVQTNKGSSSSRRWNVKDWELETISDLKLIDPVCQGSMIRAKLNGKQFGVFTNIYSDNATRTNLLLRVSADFKHWSQCMFLTLPGEVVHGYSSMCCINDVFSIVSEDAKGVYYMPFGYEYNDRLLRIYSENNNTYKKK